MLALTLVSPKQRSVSSVWLCISALLRFPRQGAPQENIYPRLKSSLGLDLYLTIRNQQVTGKLNVNWIPISAEQLNSPRWLLPSRGVGTEPSVSITTTFPANGVLILSKTVLGDFDSSSELSLLFLFICSPLSKILFMMPSCYKYSFDGLFEY